MTDPLDVTAPLPPCQYIPRFSRDRTRIVSLEMRREWSPSQYISVKVTLTGGTKAAYGGARSADRPINAREVNDAIHEVFDNNPDLSPDVCAIFRRKALIEAHRRDEKQPHWRTAIRSLGNDAHGSAKERIELSYEEPETIAGLPILVIDDPDALVIATPPTADRRYHTISNGGLAD